MEEKRTFSSEFIASVFVKIFERYNTGTDITKKTMSALLRKIDRDFINSIWPQIESRTFQKSVEILQNSIAEESGEAPEEFKLLMLAMSTYYLGYQDAAIYCSRTAEANT